MHYDCKNENYKWTFFAARRTRDDLVVIYKMKLPTKALKYKLIILISNVD